MFGIGMQELLIIGVVALLGIGPKRLPEVAQFLGKGYAKIKKATDDLQQSVKVEFEEAKREEYKKKFPHLAVEDPASASKTDAASADKPAGDAPAEEAGEGKQEVPVTVGEGGEDPYDLSAPVVKAASAKATAPGASVEAPKKTDG